MEIVNNHVTHQGNTLEFGGYSVKKEIARGANGIVYEAKDTLLQRTVAIKVWMKLRPADKRDKIQQGILEARKAFNAQSDSVIEIYHAGVTRNLFFVVMEYFDGVPLQQYLVEHKPTLGMRVHFATTVLVTCNFLHEKGIYHGDLHVNNILVKKNIDDVQGDVTLKYLDFRIIDFGTSHFAHSRFSKRRYFNQLVALTNQLSAPFSIREIYGYAYPEKATWSNIYHWMLDYNSFIPLALVTLGYSKLEECLEENWLEPEDEKGFLARVPTEFVESIRKSLTGKKLSQEAVGGWESWGMI